MSRPAEPQPNPRAQVRLSPPAADWREALAQRLGQRPRRLGTWAELALWGARECLDRAGLEALPADARLRVASRHGPATAIRSVVEQCRSGAPMPFAFMQSQPGQMLAALAQHLHWRGDASFLACPDVASALAFALEECSPTGLLLGWVEESGGLHSEWWWFAPAAEPAAA